jgi:demethylmenaquinone methyltransferase/2-methoxy-6-polyprenyl-1,4-benzoquinol methylase
VTPPRPRQSLPKHPTLAASTDPSRLILSQVMSMSNQQSTTHFGYQEVAEEEKARHVAEVFDSVAQRYDLMNDLMSGGLHRLWKAFTLAKSGVRESWRVLDVAGGTGDLALAFARKLGSRGQVWLTDINHAMLVRGRDRLCNQGFIVPVAQCDAEKLPFPDDYFDCVTVAFGLRNMTHKDLALAEMRRVLRPGGRLLVLEFSQVWKPLAAAYDFYSFQVIPRLGQMITHDEASYRYLAESIRMHPDQEALKSLMEQAGLEQVEYYNLALGVVALHRAFKF